MTTTYEIFALEYGRVEHQQRRNMFLRDDSHESILMPLHYFVWVVRNGDRVWLVDTGFDHETAKKRDRKIDRLPMEALQLIGISADAITETIITHLHYDHAGTWKDFPNTRFHLQEAEMAQATGRAMTCAALRTTRGSSTCSEHDPSKT